MQAAIRVNDPSCVIYKMKLKKNIAISDEGLVFNPSSGESFSVNPIGMKIIRMLKEGKPRAEISKSLCAEFDVDSKTMEKDLGDFTQMLSRYQILDLNEEKKA